MFSGFNSIGMPRNMEVVAHAAVRSVHSGTQLDILPTSATSYILHPTSYYYIHHIYPPPKNLQNLYLSPSKISIKVYTTFTLLPSTLYYKQQRDSYLWTTAHESFPCTTFSAVRMFSTYRLLSRTAVAASAAAAAAGTLSLCKSKHIAEAESKRYPAESVYDCIVVGSGVSGLSAAYSLIHTHSLDPKKVLVLEAQDYVGGRLRQTSDFVKGVNVELGGEFLHGDC